MARNGRSLVEGFNISHITLFERESELDKQKKIEAITNNACLGSRLLSLLINWI